MHIGQILHNPEFWAACINFSLLVYVLRRMGKKPISEFLVQRRREMEQQMKDAAEMKQKAEARYEEYSQRLASLDDELKKLESNIVAAAAEDKKRIVAEAQEAAERMKRETESLIDQHKKALSAEIREQLVASAVAAAERVLHAAITTHDQEQLAERFKRDLTAASKVPS